MGRWIVYGGSGAAGPPGPGGSGAPAAPNVTSATGAATYGQFGNDSAFGFAGVITLPTSDPNYSHLKTIIITAFKPGSVNGAPIATLQAPFSGSTVSYATTFNGDQIIQPVAPITWTLQFTTANEDGSPTGSPVTVTASVQGSFISSISSASENPANRTSEANTRLVYTHPSFVPVLNGGQVPQNVMFWESLDNGVNYTPVAWNLVTGVGQSISWTVVAPVASENWKVAACIYSDVIPFVGGVSITAAQMTANVALSGQTAVISASFSVIALQLPAANLITALNITAGTGPANWPYNFTPPDGLQYWLIPPMTYDDSACLTDWNAYFVRITIQDYGASGTPVGPEVPFSGYQVVGGVQTTLALDQEYGLNGGDGYTRTAAIASEGFRVYVSNRADETATAFSNVLASTLQTSIGTGGLLLVAVAAAGALPPGMVNLARANPSTLAPTLALDPATGLLRTTSLDTTNMVQNGDFELGTFDGWSLAYGTAAVVSSPAIGNYSCSMNPFTSGINAGLMGIWETNYHPAKPGSNIYAECELNFTGTAVGSGHCVIAFYNAAGASVVTYVSPAASLTSGWQTVSISGVAPANTASVQFQVYVQFEATSGVTWYVDAIRMQQQVSTGSGTQPNGTGGVALNIASPFDIVAQQLALQTASITNTYLGTAAVQAGNMAASSVTAANAAIAANTIVDSQVINVGVPKLLSGTNIFTGDVILSRGTGNPVIDLSNSGMFLYGVASGSSGLTSSPYVSITSGAIGVQASSTGHAVTITGSAVTLWTVNGSTSSPYLQLTPSSLTLSYSPYTIFISPGEIQLSDGSATVTILSGTITLTSGSYSTQITASQILMSNGSQFLSLTSSSVLLEYNSSNSIQLTSGSLSVTLGGLTSTISGNTLTTNEVFAITSVNCLQLNLTSGGFISWTGFTSSGSSVIGYVEAVVGGSVFKIQILS